MHPSEDAAAALAANLRERAKALDEVGPEHEDALLRTFHRPSWQELQQQEAYQAGQIADTAARVIFGRNWSDSMTPRIAADLEQGATYLVRRLSPEFLLVAHQMAVEALLTCDEFKALASGRSRSAADLRIIAHRLASTVRAALHGTLEATTPIRPAVYLRCAAAATERGAR